MAQKNTCRKLLRLLQRAHEAKDNLNFEGALLVMGLSPQLKFADLSEGTFKSVPGDLADAALEILSQYAGDAVTISPRRLEIFNFWNSWLKEDCADLSGHPHWVQIMELIQIANNHKIDNGDKVSDLGFPIYQMLMSFGQDGLAPEYDFVLGRLTFIGPETFEKRILPLLDIHKMNLKWSFYVEHCPDDPGEREIRTQLQKWFKDKPYAEGRDLMITAMRTMEPIMVMLYNESLLGFMRLNTALESGAAIARSLRQPA